MWKMFKEFYQEMYSRAQYVNISYMLLLAAPLASEGSVFEEWMGRKIVQTFTKTYTKKINLNSRKPSQDLYEDSP